MVNEQLVRQMHNLPNYIGKEVSVSYMDEGKGCEKKGKFLVLKPFSCLTIKDNDGIKDTIQFLGMSKGIKEIKVIEEREETIYGPNSKVDKNYRWPKSWRIKRECFGDL